MEPQFITALGLVAGTLTTIAYLPQLIKTWQTKSAHDLSWSMLITLCVGIILWLIYGIYVEDIPLIAANIVTLIFSSIILFLKVRYRTGSITTDHAEIKEQAEIKELDTVQSPEF